MYKISKSPPAFLASSSIDNVHSRPQRSKDHASARTTLDIRATLLYNRFVAIEGGLAMAHRSVSGNMVGKDEGSGVVDFEKGRLMLENECTAGPERLSIFVLGQ